jgi:hypothetical protein
MKFTLKNKEIAPMDILIDFFASLYDLVYDSISFLLKAIIKLALTIKKVSLMKILIDFFASLYDWVVTFFASLYDIVYAFIFFLVEYVKWATDIRSYKSTDFATQAKQPIRVNNQAPFNIR